MKQSIRWFTSALIATSVLFASTASSEARGRGFPKATKEAPKPVYTAIASVNPAAMTITTEAKNVASANTKTFNISPRATITLNGNPAKLTDLKPGLQIRIGAGADANVAEELSASNPPAEPQENHGTHEKKRK